MGLNVKEGLKFRLVNLLAGTHPLHRGCRPLPLLLVSSSGLPGGDTRPVSTPLLTVQDSSGLPAAVVSVEGGRSKTLDTNVRRRPVPLFLCLRPKTCVHCDIEGGLRRASGGGKVTLGGGTRRRR